MGKGMRAGKKPSSGGAKNQQQQMAQLQMMQKKMDDLQEEINKMEATSTAGGGAVTVTVNGEKKLTKISIKPEVVDADDVEMLEDLIMVAANEALREMEEISNSEMEKLYGSMGLPMGI